MNIHEYIKNLSHVTRSQEFSINKEKKIFCVQTDLESIVKITIITDLDKLTLHWGLGLNHHNEWVSPLREKGRFFNSQLDCRDFDQKHPKQTLPS